MQIAEEIPHTLSLCASPPPLLSFSEVAISSIRGKKVYVLKRLHHPASEAEKSSELVKIKTPQVLETISTSNLKAWAIKMHLKIYSKQDPPPKTVYRNKTIRVPLHEHQRYTHIWQESLGENYDAILDSLHHLIDGYELV